MGTASTTALRVVLSHTGRQSHLLRTDGLTECGKPVAQHQGDLGESVAIYGPRGGVVGSTKLAPSCQRCSRHLTAFQLKEAGLR